MVMWESTRLVEDPGCGVAIDNIGGGSRVVADSAAMSMPLLAHVGACEGQ